ncbi:MaoC family dehydratase [Aestuariivirga sp.]|uniref:MaoC family dehydratase n=1 Tax=Aestuariivirga sp. TaxID=2650926 RepID=UPI00391C90CB
MNPCEEAVGASVSCSKTVGESDVYLFAGITGDFSPNHVDETAMAATGYGGRIAHGALLVGYMSRASTLIGEQCGALMREHYPVSLGYDRVRFLQGVRIGDTVTVTYRIEAADPLRMRTIAAVSLHNQSGTCCAVATHLMKWLRRPG